MLREILSVSVLSLAVAGCSEDWDGSSGSQTKLAQCPQVVTPGVTLLSDSREDYQAASDAFMTTYGGAIGGLSSFKKVDIKYPNGSSATFKISWTSDGERVVLSSPRLNESSSKDANHCAA
ncbi:hypothetical protein [Roseateles sp.]|uniref:hypothetical protein n=1 Tax=Roseateles sp. TaxID=1971397 RepID=UPI0031CE6119